VETVAQERPPGFLAAFLAASGAHVLALILVGVAAVPLSLVGSTAIVLSPEPSAGFRLLLPWIVLLAAEPFLAASIAKGGLSLFDAGRVTYVRALAAMILALVVTAAAARVLPGGAARTRLGRAGASLL
jgi:hypothetical protein